MWKLLIVLLAVATIFGADLTGTYRLNIAKSKLERGIKNRTLKLEKAGATYKYITDTVRNAGPEQHAEAVCDGKDFVDENGLTIHCDFVNGTLKMSAKSKREVLWEQTLVASGGGKVVTVSRKGMDPGSKQPYTEMLVYDRQ